MPELIPISPEQRAKVHPKKDTPETEKYSSPIMQAQPFKEASKHIKKDKNRKFVEKLLQRNPDAITKRREMRNKLRVNNREFNKLECDSKAAMWDMIAIDTESEAESDTE